MDEAGVQTNTASIELQLIDNELKIAPNETLMLVSKLVSSYEQYWTTISLRAAAKAGSGEAPQVVQSIPVCLRRSG